MSSIPASLQPVVVYPNVNSNQTSHSKGSFGPVFAVLAIITVLAAVACILGRLCARRLSSHGKTRRDRDRDHTFHVRDDLENGFRSSPVAKPVGDWGGREAKPGKYGGKEAKPAKKAGSKEPKSAGSKEGRPASKGGSKEGRPAMEEAKKPSQQQMEDAKRINMQKMEEAKKQNLL